jgi:hypothetical protein
MLVREKTNPSLFENGRLDTIRLRYNWKITEKNQLLGGVLCKWPKATRQNRY